MLNEHKVHFELLPGTNDVWARDYMPVQMQKNTFVRFDYYPDYLETEEEKLTITDTVAVCKKIGIETLESKIVLDGGNVVNSGNKVIMTEKVFKENPSYSREDLIRELKGLFETDDLFFIPKQPYDYTGHADGMVRFVDDNTILINDYERESKTFNEKFRKAILKTGLEFHKMPYNPYESKTNEEANGAYINYLHIGNLIILPLFDLKEDKIAIKTFEQIFKNSTIVTINATEIAREGGVLNCISWNILK